MKHSQKASAKPLEVWCIVSKEGYVSAAHCTCMAGNSEVCSHVGAILFAAEYANKKKEEVSCTDTLGTWMMPSTSAKLPLVPVNEMNWGNPFQISNVNQKVKPLTELELDEMLKKMVELGSEAAIMRIIEPFATDIAKEANPVLPSVLNIFNESHTTLSYMELMKISKSIDLTITREQKNLIEKCTRNQAENQLWYMQRAGRITASRFRAVCRTKITKPSLSLIKLICYPTKGLFSTKATLWGITKEDNAVEAYQKVMEEENHDSFIINKVGFVINQRWPQFGASPDRLVFCECCLGGCLEVKCPYLLRSTTFESLKAYAAVKNSCLVEKDEEVVLSKSHPYYFQVQMQIFVTNVSYCDFVIWSPNLFFKQRVLPDFEFWEKYSETAKKFHSEVIMPELLGKYFTKKEGAAEIEHFCICNGVDDGRPMIKCEADNCKIGWFHFDCVELIDTPETIWFCQKCNK